MDPKLTYRKQMLRNGSGTENRTQKNIYGREKKNQGNVLFKKKEMAIVGS